MKLNLHKIHINALNNKSDKRHWPGERLPLQMRLINVNKLNIFFFVGKLQTSHGRTSRLTTVWAYLFVEQLLTFQESIYRAFRTNTNAFGHFFVGLFVQGWPINRGSWLRAQFIKFQVYIYRFTATATTQLRLILKMKNIYLESIVISWSHQSLSSQQCVWLMRVKINYQICITLQIKW